MRSTIKTIILAAASAAIIASPAFAKSKRAPVEQDVPAAAQLYQGNTGAQGADTFGQISNEYLKDAPTHNGNSY